MKKFVINHVFVPSSGDLFLIRTGTLCILPARSVVFVPSSGDLFLMQAVNIDIYHAFCASFRPLFWGFVFNNLFFWSQSRLSATSVFVPSSGDLFLIRRRRRR